MQKVCGRAETGAVADTLVLLLFPVKQLCFRFRLPCSGSPTVPLVVSSEQADLPAAIFPLLVSGRPATVQALRSLAPEKSANHSRDHINFPFITSHSSSGNCFAVLIPPPSIRSGRLAAFTGHGSLQIPRRGGCECLRLSLGRRGMQWSDLLTRRSRSTCGAALTLATGQSR